MALSNLPTELVESIATYLEPASFRSFRCVCSSLNTKSLHHFRERFFRRRKLRWTAGKLRELLDVVWDPFFSKNIQALHVDATPRHAIRLWKLKVNIANNEQNYQIKSQLDAEYDVESAKADEATRFWNETRYDQKTMITIFERLKMLHSVTFSYDPMDGKMYGKFSRRYCENSQNEMSRPFVSTMAAIALSGVVVREILIDPVRPYGAISEGRLATLGPFLSKFDKAFESLATLKISLRDWRRPEPGFEGPLDKAPFVVRFLEKCVNLRHLAISCFSVVETDIFPHMAQRCHYPHMQTCTLDLFRISAKDLFLFLGSAKSSLRNVTLSHVVLRDDEATWRDVLLRMSTDLDVDMVRIENVFTKIGASIGIDGTLRSAITLTGPNLGDMLRYHADNLISGHWGSVWHVQCVSYPFHGLLDYGING